MSTTDHLSGIDNGANDGHFCPVCRRNLESFASGPGGRPNARCPKCQSLERHRYLALLMAAFAEEIASSRHILEVAPTRSVTHMLKGVSTGFYIGIDVDPSADGRNVQVVADLCAAPFAGGTFETSVCFHVFEHIPDDLAAMREYARILAPTGIGFIQNPWRPSASTDEDPSAPAEDRIRRFGQADHVRMYGADFEDRLRSVGLEPRRVAPEDVMRPATIATIGMTPGMPIWLVFGPMSRYRPMSQGRFVAKIRRRVDRVTRTFNR